jgi:TonB-dependent receptor
MPGATVLIEAINAGTVTDLDGNYSLKAPPGTYTVRISFVSFNTVELTDVIVEADKTSIANVAMEQASTGIEEVVITAVRRMNTEVSMIASIRASNMVISGVSSQQISRTQDRDASEVIKRVPGISIIENRFIIARGLSQRYNNVWINNNPVPSTEADSRAFSFDMIPSAQIENMMIIKSPAPELPADFSGGFVKIATRSTLEENTMQVSYGININTKTHFRDFKYAKGSSTDFLGYDNGFRGMRSAVPPQRMDNRNAELVTNVTANGFNNDWAIHTRKPFADHRFSMMINRFAMLNNGGRIGMAAALNYSYSYLNHQNMTNARFGIYNKQADQPVYTYRYEDDQYTVNARVGGMVNLIWALSGKHRFEVRNIFNQQGRNRYTYRDGWQMASGEYEQEKEEYHFNSRGTYTGQLSGVHNFTVANRLDWTIGYSYANNNRPDRREINRDKSANPQQFELKTLFRDFIRLDEYIYSAGINHSYIFSFGSFAPTLKTGVYADYRTRDYNTRNFRYNYFPNNVPQDFGSWRITDMMRPEYLSADRLFVNDATDMTFDYTAENMLKSAYVALNIPIGKFNIYAGLRYENNLMTLHNNLAIIVVNPQDTEKIEYPQSDFFPSINATYNINRTSLLRFAYGKSINRQEFREVSPSSYYDFDMFSFVRGYKELKHAYIQNFDFRYEVYPTSGEMISFAVFYKKFINPIEWTFRDGGDTRTFMFENADAADTYGIELDVRKTLDFIGLPYLSLSFNGALINSEVKFGEESLEHNRPMQGQSPYIVNTGLFYQRNRLSAGMMYNIIGKRIVGIGRNDNSQGGSIDSDIPDMYEMPRHAIDLSASYRFGQRFELNAGIRDILAAPIVYKQFPKFMDDNGKVHEREQTTREYRPGQTFSVALRVNL